MQIFWNKELHQSVKPHLLLQKKAVMVWTSILPGAEANALSNAKKFRYFAELHWIW